MTATAVRSAERASAEPPGAPPARPLWWAALVTGFGAAAIGAVAGIAIVAACWLPVSGHTGSAGSTLRAGALTYLAALHGGIMIDGTAAAFAPLGLTLGVAVLLWRAGRILADIATDDAGDDAASVDRSPAELLWAGAAQGGAFAVTSGVLAAIATLGTSSASVAPVVLAALLLWLAASGTAFARSTPLRDTIADRVPSWLPRVGRAAAVGVLVELAAGAVLVAGSLVMHHGRVEDVAHAVGGGWGALPVLLLGVAAAPNAAVAGVAYLAGPGIALGSGNAVTLGAGAHGTLPAFPVLAAVPATAAGLVVWAFAVAVPLVTGACVSVLTWPAGSGLRERLRDCAAAAVGAGLVLAIAAWLAGGGIGAGRLRVLGASPWQLGATVTVETAVGITLAVGARTVWHAVAARLRDRGGEDAAE